MLKPKQRQIAEYMVLNPDLSNEQYAEHIGINPKTLYAWKKNEEFCDYIHQLCREKFKNMEKLALNKLQKEVEKGNMKAVLYVLDGVGYKATEQVEVTEKTINIHIED
jgi:DNA-binding XRE family transcriptional regulator